MTNRKKYCLIQDNDCHWYILPWENQEAAEKYFEDNYKYWNGSVSEQEKYNCPVRPKWLSDIDSPEMITFENFEEIS